jgi:hypothetical protein
MTMDSRDRPVLRMHMWLETRRGIFVGLGRMKLLEKIQDVCAGRSVVAPRIDLRKLDALPHLDTLSVGLAHLDMLAQEKGFNPMVRAPWDTFESATLFTGI